MSNLLTNQAKKVMAERMFVEDGMTAKAIAEQLDVSEQTLSKWRKGKEGEEMHDFVVNHVVNPFLRLPPLFSCRSGG